jgi:DNA double-strand break repair helicase HerA and related ATPase
VQHALRAFTPDDAKQLKQTVSTFPKSEFYDLAELLTQLGTGEAAVTILSESGVPTPVVHTKMRAPESRMAPADDVDGAAKASPLYAKYGTRTESQSAREMLAARIAKPATNGAAPKPQKEHKEAATATAGGAEAIGKFLASRQGQRLEREVVRGVFGLLKKSM